MRLLLEPLAIRVAATHHTEADAEKLRNLYDKWRTSQTRDVHGDEYDTANQEFHFGLYGLDPTAEMKPFHALLHRHWERYTRYRRVYYWRTADFSQISGNHHLRLLEAWATRDADRAEKLLAHHVLSAGCTLVHSLTAEGPAEYSPQLREVADRYGCELEDPAPHATGDSVGRQSADDRVEPFSGRFG
ncbi:MAG: GntR family transcriptional regulator [Comamonadaceae bacterium]|nr:MAG: GntR family transcriptional regulator [Comamonadaceae bacterium]